ncbi:MAG: hypothetical protein COA50_10300 [Flavobacteriaceae bacterium]|nr:MAG: hypothetical protein COA50_10300 [Flavobacteriaceae bacterium]
MIYVNIIGIAILSIFGLFIITKKSKVLSDFLLLLVIFLFSGILVSGILLEHSPSAFQYGVFLFFNSFIFPGLIIYGLVLLDEHHKFKMQWLWTASYAILFLLFVGVDILILNTYNTPEQVNGLIQDPSLWYYLFYKGQYVFVIAILIWLIGKLNVYKRKIKDYFSSIETIHLNWFKNFIYCYLGVNVISLLLFIGLDLNLMSDISIPLFIEHLILVLALFYLCFHGIKQYNLAELNVYKDLQLTTQKYSSSSLSAEEMQNLYKQIEQLFQEGQVYLEPELKIDVIANKLNVTTHRISQTINTLTLKPFYDYVNSFRVDHLKELLLDTDHRKFTILALGIESGFNSKATLNRTFKQHVGMTPKAFQQRNITI